MCFSRTLITSINYVTIIISQLMHVLKCGQVIATKLVHAHRWIHGWAEFCIQCCNKNGVLTSATLLVANIQTIPCVRYTIVTSLHMWNSEHSYSKPLCVLWKATRKTIHYTMNRLTRTGLSIRINEMKLWNTDTRESLKTYNWPQE